jgi:hypothetical protein
VFFQRVVGGLQFFLVSNKLHGQITEKLRLAAEAPAVDDFVYLFRELIVNLKMNPLHTTFLLDTKYSIKSGRNRTPNRLHGARLGWILA